MTGETIYLRNLRDQHPLTEWPERFKVVSADFSPGVSEILDPDTSVGYVFDRTLKVLAIQSFKPHGTNRGIMIGDPDETYDNIGNLRTQIRDIADGAVQINGVTTQRQIYDAVERIALDDLPWAARVESSLTIIKVARAILRPLAAITAPEDFTIIEYWEAPHRITFKEPVAGI